MAYVIAGFGVPVIAIFEYIGFYQKYTNAISFFDMVWKRASKLPKVLTAVEFSCFSVLFVASVVFSGGGIDAKSGNDIFQKHEQNDNLLFLINL